MQAARFRFFVLATLLATFFAAGAVSAEAADKPQATALERVQAYVEPSIVYIGIQWTGYVYDQYNKQWLTSAGAPKAFTVHGQCTGYVVNPGGYVATAAHCVTPDNTVKSWLREAGAHWALDNGYYSQPGQLTADGVMADYTAQGADDDDGKLIPHPSVSWGVTAGGVKASKSYNARVLDKQSPTEGDAALLKIDATGLLPLRLASASPRVGEDIVSIGYPASVDSVTDLDYAPSYKDGSVSQKKTTGGGLVETYEISAAMSGGMSGGPTVDLDHRVVGTNSFSVLGESQQFNFIQPAGLVRELLRSVGIKNALGAIGTEYYTGLDAYFDGDKASAVDHLQKVVDEQPSNAPAQEFLDKAKKLKGGSGLGLVLIGLVLVLGVAAGAAVFRRRAKRPAPVSQAGAIQVPRIEVASAQAPLSTPESAAPAEDGAQADTEGRRFCSSCGKRLDTAANFCEHCGAKVD